MNNQISQLSSETTLVIGCQPPIKYLGSRLLNSILSLTLIEIFGSREKNQNHPKATLKDLLTDLIKEAIGLFTTIYCFNCREAHETASKSFNKVLK